jgi:hypothetical protein
MGDDKPVFEEYDPDQCDCPCDDPAKCKKTTAPTGRLKKISFYLIVIVALFMSFQKTLMKEGSSEVDVPSGTMPSLESTTGPITPTLANRNVNIVYLPSEDNAENLAILARLDEAAGSIRGRGGELRVHKLTTNHEHFGLLSNKYKIEAYPVTLVFGPDCCSKYMLKQDFTVDRFVRAYDLASADKKSKSDSADSCKDQNCK